MVLLAVLGKNLLPAFSNANTFLQSSVTSCKMSAKTVLSMFAPTLIEALLLFHAISLVNEWMDDKRVNAKTELNAVCGVGAAMYVVNTA